MSAVLAALLIPFLGTALGSGFVFFMKRDMPMLLQKVLLGFASGVMVAASVWSLLIPSLEMGTGTGAVIPAVAGLLAGFAFLLLIDYVTPHIHPLGGPEGPHSTVTRLDTMPVTIPVVFAISQFCYLSLYSTPLKVPRTSSTSFRKSSRPACSSRMAQRRVIR